MNPITMKLVVDDLILQALREDITFEDVSTASVCPTARPATVELIAKADGIIAGLDVFARTFELLDPQSSVLVDVADGDEVHAGDHVGQVRGDARVLLSGERVALNYLQRMSGIATYTHQMAAALEGTKTVLVDTRKTTPGMRVLDKMAVKLGGGAAIAAVMALFVLSTVFYYNLMQVNKVFVLLAGFAACVVLLTLCVSFYFFPMLAMVDLPLGALLKNSMALVFGNIGKTLLALLLFVLLIGLGVGLLPYSFIFAALIMFSFVASITTYLTSPAIAARGMRREEGHAAGELYQTLPQQEQPEVQLRSAGLDELRFEDDETEENAEN